MQCMSSHKESDFGTKNHASYGEKYQGSFIAPLDRGLAESGFGDRQQITES